MTLQEITDMMGSLLEVDLDRYPQVQREIHVNQAIMEDLSAENDFPFDQILETLTSGLTDSSFALSTLVTGRKVVRVKSMWTTEADLTPVKYKDMGAMLDIPTAFTQYGMTLYLNGPIEALDEIPSITAKAKQGVLTASQSNDWTEYVPYLVAYQACVHASVWLVEEERVPLFSALLRDSMIKASVEYGIEVEASGQLEES